MDHVAPVRWKDSLIDTTFLIADVNSHYDQIIMNMNPTI